MCRSHARLHDSQKGPEHERRGPPTSPPLLLKSPLSARIIGTNTEAMANHLASPPARAISDPSGVTRDPDPGTTSKTDTKMIPVFTTWHARPDENIAALHV